LSSLCIPVIECYNLEICEPSDGSQEPMKDANAAAQAISALEGVVDHGLFLNMASAVIIAGSDGVSVQSKDT
jgi:ribose 5-phosphate isomerase